MQKWKAKKEGTVLEKGKKEGTAPVKGKEAFRKHKRTSGGNLGRGLGKDFTMGWQLGCDGNLAGGEGGGKGNLADSFETGGVKTDSDEMMTGKDLHALDEVMYGLGISVDKTSDEE